MHLPKGYILENRYEVEEVLGEGGFGKTYLVFDHSLKYHYCLKELFVAGISARDKNQGVRSVSVGGLSFSDIKERFVREAQALARFNHPGIVKVVNIFESNNTAYYVMEYVKGESLGQKVRKGGRLERNMVIDIMMRLLSAVEEVHNSGRLHRDIKPDNVLYTASGRVVLIDFGSVREFNDGKTLTQTAILTPGYAPVEQYSERAVRSKSLDIYALGATMFFLLTGKKPLPAIDRLHMELKAPHELWNDIDSQISSVIMLAMQMKSEDRFADVSEMHKALQMVRGGRMNQKGGIHSKPSEALENQNDTIEMVRIKGGTFQMGASVSEKLSYKDERPVHKVTLKSFSLGKYPVTREEWQRIMGSSGVMKQESTNCAARNVSFAEVQRFIRELNKRTGKSYRLPTEAEWEFAARGGDVSKGFLYAGSNDLDEVAWHYGNSQSKVHPVGQKRPNELGLYDLSGNVWEWCADFKGAYSSNEQSNPLGPDKGVLRVCRGGSWKVSGRSCRVTRRESFPPLSKREDLGFRLAHD